MSWVTYSSASTGIRIDSPQRSNCWGTRLCVDAETKSSEPWCVVYPQELKLTNMWLSSVFLSIWLSVSQFVSLLVYETNTEIRFLNCSWGMRKALLHGACLLIKKISGYCETGKSTNASTVGFNQQNLISCTGWRPHVLEYCWTSQQHVLVLNMVPFVASIHALSRFLKSWQLIISNLDSHHTPDLIIRVNKPLRYLTQFKVVLFSRW